MSAAAGGVFSGLGRAWQLRGSPCRCFVAGTPVQMADGTTKRICDVEVGDQVLSRDPATGKDEAKTVTATVERHAPSVVDVALRDAKTGQAETLICTPEHPLYVQGQGWVEAGSVGIGTSIVSRAGPALQVTALTWQRNKAEELAAGTGSPFGGYTVYNLTVEDDHTFFVGNTGGGTWVHNNTCALTYKTGWTQDQVAAADAKVAALNEAATANGGLTVGSPGRSGPSAASMWRANANYVNSAVDDVDHTIDLQLGGSNTVENMQTLDLSVNRSLGPQIYNRTIFGQTYTQFTIGW